MFQAKCEDGLIMNDIEKIMGILDYLLNILELREKILMDVKLMEATRFSSHLSQVNEARVECGLGAVKMVNVGKNLSSIFSIPPIKDWLCYFV